MIVLDASAAVDLILRMPHASFVETQIRSGRAIHAPDLLDAEVLGALRRRVRVGQVSPLRAWQALEVFRDLSISLHQVRPLLTRAWELRHNLTAADALYVALAEGLPAAWLTTDGPAARAAREHSSIEVLSPDSSD